MPAHVLSYFNFTGLARTWKGLMGLMENNCNDLDHHSNHRVHQKTRNRISEFILFARNFLKHPNMVGWVLPSSPFLVDEVLKRVDWDRAKVIVEYGPGVGAFTTKVLERMQRDATLI